jgi:hypothetical protein
MSLHTPCVHRLSGTFPELQSMVAVPSVGCVVAFGCVHFSVAHVGSGQRWKMLSVRGYTFLGLLVLATGAALAQQDQGERTPATTASPSMTEPSKTAAPMEERLPGDHWTVEVRDEISGAVSTVTSLVTEVTPTDLSVRADTVRPDKTNSERFITFDRSWNQIRSGPWQYFPYDGNTGVQTPIVVGKVWTFQFNAVNGTSGVTWKWSGTSRVMGQETMTTKAGTFETFRIETSASSSNFKEPTRTEELVAQTWYAPAIAHWIRRSWIVRSDGRLRSNETWNSSSLVAGSEVGIIPERRRDLHREAAEARV